MMAPAAKWAPRPSQRPTSRTSEAAGELLRQCPHPKPSQREPPGEQRMAGTAQAEATQPPALEHGRAVLGPGAQEAGVKRSRSSRKPRAQQPEVRTQLTPSVSGPQRGEEVRCRVCGGTYMTRRQAGGRRGFCLGDGGGPCSRARGLHHSAGWPLEPSAGSSPPKQPKPGPRRRPSQMDPGRSEKAAGTPTVTACGPAPSAYRGLYITTRKRGADPRAYPVELAPGSEGNWESPPGAYHKTLLQ